MYRVFLLIGIVALLVACGGNELEDIEPLEVEVGDEVQNTDIESENNAASGSMIPSVKGPSSPPVIKGPTSPPPSN